MIQFQVRKSNRHPCRHHRSFPETPWAHCFVKYSTKDPNIFFTLELFFQQLYVWVWLKIRNNGREPPLDILETFSKMVLVESGFGVNAVDLFQGGNVGCRSNIEAKVEVLCNLHDVRARTFHGERKT